MVQSQKTTQQKVWQIVHQIPVGRVATYGQIADLAGMPTHSRLVGRILSQLPHDTNLPWHRVINSQGRITNPNGITQKSRLADEGVFVINGKISLREYRWRY